MELELSGAACVVTGASHGIGRAVAHRLGEEGARVLVVSRDPEASEAVAAATGAEWLAADVSRADATERIIATCVERFGRIDVLVNNAGTMSVTPLEALTEADWYHHWELNVMGPMRLMSAAAPLMAASGGGRIVNVSSSAGKRPSQDNAAYSVTKAAQLSLSRVFAERYSRENVLVNAVAPGPVRTRLWLGAGGIAEQRGEAADGSDAEAVLGRVAARLPLGRLSEPEEVADVIVFLCSARASTVTGAAWSVDGGSVASIV